MSRLRLTKVAAPSPPATTKAELFYSLADAKLEAIDESGNIAVLGGFAARDYRLVKITYIFQGTTTYTPTTVGGVLQVKALYVECIGAGGAGGGAAVTTSNASQGSGGGAGAYSAIFLSGAAVKSSYSVSVGAGGTGVSAANGNSGDDTTFDSPSVCTAKGGAFGFFAAAGTAPALVHGGFGGAGSSGIGDLRVDGNAGGFGITVSATVASGGAGGSTVLGGTSSAGPNFGSNPGYPAGNYGAGGTGAASINGAAQPGGPGANGLIRIWEFA